MSRAVRVRVRVRRGGREEAEEQGLPPTAWTPTQGAGGRGGSVSWHQVAGVLAVLGGASLVEEVGLEGGGQRQPVDLSQALLPQGQAHGAAAEIHERQGLGWGNRGGGERESGSG